MGFGGGNSLPPPKIYSPNFPVKTRVKPLDPSKSPQPTENKREKHFQQVAY
jgi:hypothetical protein